MIGGFHFAGLAPPLPILLCRQFTIAYYHIVCLRNLRGTSRKRSSAAGLFLEEACRIVRRQIVWQKKIKLEFQTDDIKDIKEIDRGWVSQEQKGDIVDVPRTTFSKIMCRYKCCTLD